jgi:hypothetical protein
MIGPGETLAAAICCEAIDPMALIFARLSQICGAHVLTGAARVSAGSLETLQSFGGYIDRVEIGDE